MSELSAGSAPEVVVQVRGVRFSRAGRVVLEVPSLDVRRGEVLGVLGSNGAGKTTLLHVLGGLLSPAEGEVRLGGGAPVGSLAARRRVALVMQDGLLLDATVLANVTLGLRFRGIVRRAAESEARRWLDAFGVGHLAGRWARGLSGGEAQRVSLARAFTSRAELLLLDEPFASLDGPTRAALLGELASVLRSTRATAVLVTHEFAEVAALAHRVALLEQGRIRRIGSPEALFGEQARRVAVFPWWEVVARE